MLENDKCVYLNIFFLLRRVEGPKQGKVSTGI